MFDRKADIRRKVPGGQLRAVLVSRSYLPNQRNDRERVLAGRLYVGGARPDLNDWAADRDR